jgi:flavin-dependent dehydrogenase
MVHCDGGRVSLSCCVRRDRLSVIRQQHGGSAGDAVLAHILDSCLGVRRVLDGADRIGDWLAAGPLRPGIRLPRRDGFFAVGNAAGEAHPVVAEGISMAMQSAWLLARHLQTWREAGGPRTRLQSVEAVYARDWRRSFAPRLYAAAGVAHWAMRPAAVAGALPLLRRWPRLLTWGARLSGKATAVVGS